MEHQESQIMEPVKATTQKLISRQGELMIMLGLTQADLERYEAHPKAFLDDLLQETKSCWSQILSNHAKICEDTHAPTSGYYTENRFADARHKYSKITRSIYQKLESCAQQTASVHQATTVPVATQLPRMNLPTFSGSYLEWESFRDLFLSIVHQNSSLTDVQRLQYLRTCLKGEALAQIDGIPLTGEEYAGAWEALRERYENKRVLVQNHVDHLLSLPAVKRDNASELRSLCDNTKRVLRTLETFGRKENLGNDICVHLTLQRLTPSLRKDWEKHLGDDTSPPLLADLFKFLESSTRALESVSTTAQKPAAVQIPCPSRTRFSGPRAHLNTAATTRPCSCCQGEHYIGRCPEFRSKTPEQRRQLAIRCNLCLNCLSSSHGTKGCKSTYLCSKCKRSHHSLLHPDTAASTANDDRHQRDPAIARDAVTSHHAEHLPRGSNVLLATAMVCVRSSTGRCCRLRALLDQGSEASFISEAAVQRLRLQRHRAEIPIFGLGVSHAATARSFVEVGLSAASTTSPNIQLRALVLPKLTNARPPITCASSWSHLAGLQLADPSYSSFGKIELILGADIYGSLLRDGVRQGPSGAPTAQKTIFGWILSGPVNSNQTPVSHITCSHASTQELVDFETNTLLRRFWEIEELHQERALTSDEQACEEHFASTHRRDTSGRYIVRLPFRHAPLPNLRSSRAIAVQRLEQLERRLVRSPQLAEEYANFLSEYSTLGHMTTATASEANTYYMPHHAVLRESSSTTKLRVVFNASQKTREGDSLNDLLFTGPALQKDLVSIILKWRTHRYVFSADIEKMYRQIRIHDDDLKFQRIVWRKAPTEPIQDYALATVTYGTAAAPYLAIRTLHQLAADERTLFPLGAAILRHDFYVDDLLSGAEDLDTALAAQSEIRNILTVGGFCLRKWTANDPALLKEIHEEDQLQPASRVLQPDEHIRTLGLHWNAQTDSFYFQVTTPSTDGPPTKRKVLSTIARLFDPLGWLAPVIASAKILMQRLWAAQLPWDQPLPNDLTEKWTSYRRELPQLSEIVIPRWTNQLATSSLELHGFCDASQRAYAAAIYLRVTTHQAETSVRLLTAKSKVAPLKQLSIPRLELCGAVLLTRLLNAVSTAMNLKGVAAHAWTDSRIVLAWLQGHPTRWTCFVANRVSDIQSSAHTIVWHHVSSRDNPADCASRGINPSELPPHRLWWNGPDWLLQHHSAWPKDANATILSSPPDERLTINVHTATPRKEDDLLLRYSSITKLLRVTAYCRRFCANCRASRDNRLSSVLTPKELQDARLLWVRHSQRISYTDELQALHSKQPLPRRSSITRLNPFVDGNSILRVGGRLRNASLPFEERHPAIIPKGSRLAALLIAEAHHQTLHGGTQLTWSQLLRRYWLLGGRTAIRSHIHRCMVCFRARAQSRIQQMGDLPEARITPARAFLKSGVDYAGPIHLRAVIGRGHRPHKGYIALFVCLVTRAIHLEAVSDCSTAAFLAAFRRFVARRGRCAEIWSDNGTNFKGADQELRALFQSTSAHLQDIASLIANDGTQWRFIPPAAPHFGGIWEAGVKSTKTHLKRIIGDAVLTFEELSTVLTQIEAVLNSRPISPLSSDPDDVTALTPGHFLIGAALTSVPEPSLNHEKRSRLSRWQLVQQMTEHFWRRWSTEYLHHLQQRSKWTTASTNVTPGMLVLIKDERLPPTKWMLGRIVSVHPGKDGLVRVATMKTASTILKRPVTKICPLPLDQSDMVVTSNGMSTATPGTAMAGGDRE